MPSKQNMEKHQYHSRLLFKNQRDVKVPCLWNFDIQEFERIDESLAQTKELLNFELPFKSEKDVTAFMPWHKPSKAEI